MPREVEIAVIGAGVTGTATARALARRHRSVLLFEQLEPGHSRGSSHGTSRIFRLAYPDARYVRMAQESAPGWHELAAEAGEQLIFPGGSLDLGDVTAKIANALEACGIGYELLRGDEVSARWPIAAGASDVALFQPDGGTLRADRALAALLVSAQEAGAELTVGTRVATIASEPGRVRLELEDGSVTAAAVVVTAGAWTRGLLAPLGISLPLTVTRETVVYFALPAPEELPTVIDYEVGAERGIAWYALAAPGLGLKAGLHHAGPEIDPDKAGPPDDDAIRATAGWVARRYPEAAVEPVAVDVCLYTNTADQSFVLERHGRVVVGSACSGHGFKFAPVVGERLATLASEAVSFEG
jgi:sarcosine oxidase